MGLSAGALGTIVGLGGGFIVIPTLRLFFIMAPATTAGVSLFMVLANGISGSFAYLRQGRADVKLALIVAASGIPASILGAYLVRRTSALNFDVLYGALLMYFFFDIMRRRSRPKETRAVALPMLRERTIVDRDGEEFRYVWNAPVALACGLILGFVSSFFGIGGGPIFMLFFIAIFRMPAHIVTATSTFVIMLTAPVGVAAHWLAGDIDWSFALPLAAGALVGGQIGPRIARRLSAERLMLVLAFSLIAAAIALVVRHLLPAR